MRCKRALPTHSRISDKSNFENANYYVIEMSRGRRKMLLGTKVLSPLSLQDILWSSR